jgi:hypothetical protein
MQWWLSRWAGPARSGGGHDACGTAKSVSSQRWEEARHISVFEIRTRSFPLITPPSPLSCERCRDDKGGAGSASGGLGGGRKRPTARSPPTSVEVGGGGGLDRSEIRVRDCRLGAGERAVGGAAGGEEGWWRRQTLGLGFRGSGSEVLHVRWT